MNYKLELSQEFLKRKKVVQIEIKLIILKSLLINLLHDSDKFISICFKISNIYNFLILKNGSKTSLKNRCLLTGRSGGVISFLRVSRIKFRELARICQIPGLFKSSW